ncbi:MAG TPA: CarD family transcriptional regulator [Pyrinomonadaceae bacterium]|nr:CarD family transcriptional regulator [Pyrinomonadaceae bacterium]
MSQFEQPGHTEFGLVQTGFGQVLTGSTFMELRVGQKVSYPSQGVCLVEDIGKRTIGQISIKFYSLRVLSDNSTIFVPMANAESVGIRPIISPIQCDALIDKLSTDFEPVSCDWKTRSRGFTEQLQSGDIFEAADVLKKLTFLSHEKKLSFREQTLLDKSKFLIISEISNSNSADEEELSSEIDRLVEIACKRHALLQPTLMAVTVH